MPKSSVEQLRDNLTEIEDIKGQIRQAIIAKETEVPLDTPFSEYPQKIEDIQTKEDLDNVLNTQDEKIAELEAALENKTAGGKVKLNIYAQTTEPTDKNGIWLQTDKTFDKIYFDTNVVTAATWDTSMTYTSIPYEFRYGGSATVGTDIYLFGSSSARNTAYKYDTLTDTYSQLADIPYSFYGGSTIAVDTDIYLFGSNVSGNTKKAYKYDTLTDTYMALTDIPYDFARGGISYLNGIIYLLGGKDDYSTGYKYDINANSYTQIPGSPNGVRFDCRYAEVATVGEDVYIFGGGRVDYTVYVKTAYKYNMTTNVVTKLTDLPENVYYGGAISFGSSIYLFGNYSYAYKYDVDSDSYEAIPSPGASHSYIGCRVEIVQNKIFILGGNGYPTLISVYLLGTKEYNDNSIVVSQGPSLKTSLFEINGVEGRLLFYFADAWYYTTENGLDNTIPTYYGNSTEWIKFKN